MSCEGRVTQEKNESRILASSLSPHSSSGCHTVSRTADGIYPPHKAITNSCSVLTRSLTPGTEQLTNSPTHPGAVQYWQLVPHHNLQGVVKAVYPQWEGSGDYPGNKETLWSVGGQQQHLRYLMTGLSHVQNQPSSD